MSTLMQEAALRPPVDRGARYETRNVGDLARRWRRSGLSSVHQLDPQVLTQVVLWLAKRGWRPAAPRSWSGRMKT